MAVAGIVAEYNPFHTGHQHQIVNTRERLGQDAGIVAMMSGNWVQQANCAIFDKWTRAHLAVLGGTDLVLELPTVYATASAESFARGAVDGLAATGIVTHLSFGSEGGDVSALQQVVTAIESPTFQDILRRELERGVSFPSARQRAVELLLGEGATSLSHPNNTLGIEYLRAISRGQYPITPITVLRRGGAHNSIPQGTPPEFTSATDLRHHLSQEDWDYVLPYLPNGGSLLQTAPIANLSLVERGILAKIRTMTAQDWGRLPDSGEEEGLPQRMEWAAKQATSCGQFIQLVKTKRYTHARLRRLMLWAFLGIEASHRPDHPLYLRVLAFNDRGRALLKEMKTHATLPIVTKPAQNGVLTPEGQQLFDLESRWTDLYTLCLPEIGAPALEYTKSAIYVR